MEETNNLIKIEADQFLYKKNLLGLLTQYGLPHVSGSYQLNLMTWRDLDIYLEMEDMTESEFFKLGSELVATLQPHRMSFRNERKAKTQGLPNGLYWGIYFGNEREGAWKIDIWAMDKMECKKQLDFCNTIQLQLTPMTIQHILHIKSQCWQDPEYRRSFHSTDIYNAVLKKNITSVEEFRKDRDKL